MAKRKNTFLIKRSNVPGKIPLHGDLQLGELALNTADVKLYTSGTTENDIIQIGWDRIHRTGDTVTGDFNFYGDIQISGSSQPSGYALSVTGDTNFLGDVYVTGNTNTDNLFATSKITGNTISMPNFIYIESKDDFPEPVSNVITLEDNKTYFINTTVDLLGDRLVAGQNTTILGGSSENCRLKSTGLVGTALLSSNYSIPMRGLTFEADVALNLDADGNSNQAIDWFGVNFTNCNTIGLIKDYANIIWTDCAILEGADLTFSGTIATVGFVTCLFNGTAGKSIFNIPSGCTITRRFRPIYSSFVTLAGETGVTINAASIVNNDGFILDTVNFAGGGTFLSGIDYTSPKALFINNVGILNSSNLGHMFMINNTTVTLITVTNSNKFVKAQGITTIGGNNSPRFTHTNNRLTYVGNVRGNFYVSVASAIRSLSSNQILSISIAKNGTVVADSEIGVRTPTANQDFPGSCQTIVEMLSGDFVEFFVKNQGSPNITVTDLSFIINKIPA